VYESGLDWEAEVPESAVRARLLGAPSAPDPVERLRRAQQWVGVAAPAFALPDLEGRPVTLAAHHGRDVVVLDFWATWCGPCVTLFPEVVALEKEFAGRPVVFYAVNVMESADTARRFLAAKDLPLRVLLDEDGAVARRYEVTGIPRTVIIGKDGAVVGVRVGHAADFAETTRRDLESALGGN
jgi:thiol-disulfide isomerase/thioredoxin